MNTRTMQAFVEIFPQNFPVAFNQMGFAACGYQLAHWPVIKVMQAKGIVCAKIIAAFHRADKQQPIPVDQTNAAQTMIRFVEIGRVTGRSGSCQCAVGVKAPRMIGT